MINWSDFKVVGRELEYLTNAFKSGWVSGGEYVHKIEQTMEHIYEGSTAVAVSNGTVALQLAFQVLKVNSGDHVIVPSFCFQAASNVLRQINAIPVFCDVDPLNWNQSLKTIQAAITPETVGVVVVHNYGIAAPVADISSWVEQNGLWLIEDCAEAWFTKHGERYVGQYGSISTFSMHATKTISSGEGGMVIINDSSLVSNAKLMRSHGLDRQHAQYLHKFAGNNYRLSNLLAAVAYGQLEKNDEIILCQHKIAEEYMRLLCGHWAIEFQQSNSSKSDVIWAVAVLIKFDKLNIDRDELIDIMFNEYDIETRPGFYPAKCLSYNADLNLITSFVADRLYKDILVLPCSQALESSDIKYICESLLSIIDSRKTYKSSYRIIDVQEYPESKVLIEKFYNELHVGRTFFRYFDKRAYDVVNNHHVTLLIECGDEIVGYGHLDPDKDKVWLGIAISDKQTDMGWGKIIMHSLIKKASSLKISNLVLRVDECNESAISLYKSFGFVIEDDSGWCGSLAMTLNL